MTETSDTLPDDVDALKSLVREQQHKLGHQSQFIDQLLEQIKLGRHKRFGASSERFSLRQLQLLFNEAEAAAASDEAQSDDDGSSDESTDDSVNVAPHQRAKGGRRPLPPQLPRLEIIYELDEAACQCEQCNGVLEVIGEKVSEQLDVIRARVQVLRHVRHTYRCPHCVGQLNTAPRPAQPIPKSNASPGTLADVATAKYVDELPLYRQEQQLKRIGVDLPRATLANWMVRAGAMVQPLINLLRERMLDYPVLAMDETRLQVIKEPGRAAQSQSYCWVQRGGPPGRPIVLFDYDISRAQSVPIRLLGEYAGYLQTDGYEGYAEVCADNGITALGCWAHARRKFDEALKAQGKGRKAKDSLAAQALKHVQALYQVERKAKHLRPDERLALRQTQSQPVLDALHQWLQTHQPLVPPQSALGKAMTYLHNQWDKLSVYATDGRLAIDNNATENAIRPFVIGRKNFLFCDTVAVSIRLYRFTLGVLTLAFNKIGNFSIYPEPTDGARLIVNGPYRYIRHPMYAALSLMMLGIALYNGHGLNALAWALLLSALVGKILREEQFLPSVFPQHAAYAKRTAWLIPRLW